MNPILQVGDLRVNYRTGSGGVQAVDGVSFDLHPGDYLGLVGESGCGKSTIAKALLGILPGNAQVAGSMRLDGDELVGMAPSRLRALRGTRIALIPQSAMNGFDPVYPVRRQLDEAMTAHVRWSAERREQRMRELFELVGIDPKRLDDHAHQFSGGMRQRAMIAMAMLLDPALVVADEPTTGLDVIVQDQILRRIRALHREQGKTMLLITHDMAVVAENCNRIVVMYAGQVMEHGSQEVFLSPSHPYTMGLCNAFPELGDEERDLISIPGSPPALNEPPTGCRFAARCPFATARCRAEVPALVKVAPGHVAACHYVERADEFRRLAADPATWRGTAAVA